MGAPKALAELGGAPLIARPLAAAAAAGLDAVVVAKEDTALPVLAVPVWHEPAEPVHPLLGVVTALAGGSSVRAAVEALGPETFAVEGALVASVNTPEELAAAERAL
jgi:molybdopterin-guanine dinucleotide biosynthesis protein A